MVNPWNRFASTSPTSSSTTCERGWRAPAGRKPNAWTTGARACRWPTSATCAGYWADDYDWRSREAALNRFDQFITEIDGLDIHFVHAPVAARRRVPAADHPRLAGLDRGVPQGDRAADQPARHGGDADDAFHVVCPSLPGYGFSGKPTAPGWGVERIAAGLGDADGAPRLRPLRRPGRRLGRGGDHARSAAQRRPLRRHPPQHADRAARRRESRTNPTDEEQRALAALADTGSGTRATPSSSRPDRRRSATAWPTRRPGSRRGSSRSSGRGPTATAIPRTCSPATSCSTT